MGKRKSGRIVDNFHPSNSRLDSSLDSDKVRDTHHTIQLPIGTFELMDI
ncbi:hypothetical protein F383_27927 [Gossypium arboreum]|uniref:Uncharacterized protein n=1 Tax=Gossypium arboreum TaxID=29729 RepID=A0A0B0MV31_GOSAR|nr:hypothetical protein F383_27927 [Gossypium arboreum]